MNTFCVSCKYIENYKKQTLCIFDNFFGKQTKNTKESQSKHQKNIIKPGLCFCLLLIY